MVFLLRAQSSGDIFLHKHHWNELILCQWIRPSLFLCNLCQFHSILWLLNWLCGFLECSFSSFFCMASSLFLHQTPYCSVCVFISSPHGGENTHTPACWSITIGRSLRFCMRQNGFLKSCCHKGIGDPFLYVKCSVLKTCFLEVIRHWPNTQTSFPGTLKISFVKLLHRTVLSGLKWDGIIWKRCILEWIITNSTQSPFCKHIWTIGSNPTHLCFRTNLHQIGLY